MKFGKYEHFRTLTFFLAFFCSGSNPLIPNNTYFSSGTELVSPTPLLKSAFTQPLDSSEHNDEVSKAVEVDNDTISSESEENNSGEGDAVASAYFRINTTIYKTLNAAKPARIGLVRLDLFLLYCSLKIPFII